MTKYIDAERLRAFKEALADTIVSAQGLPTYKDCKERAEQETDVLLATLFPLQQEQPEVDLEQTIHEKVVELHTAPSYDELRDFALYFYELGRKAKEDK